MIHVFFIKLLSHVVFVYSVMCVRCMCIPYPVVLCIYPVLCVCYTFNLGCVCMLCVCFLFFLFLPCYAVVCVVVVHLVVFSYVDPAECQQVVLVLEAEQFLHVLHVAVVGAGRLFGDDHVCQQKLVVCLRARQHQSVQSGKETRRCV